MRVFLVITGLCLISLSNNAFADSLLIKKSLERAGVLAPNANFQKTKSEECTDFSGTWQGTCTDLNGTFDHEIPVQQFQCHTIQIGDMRYSVDGSMEFILASPSNAPGPYPYISNWTTRPRWDSAKRILNFTYTVRTHTLDDPNQFEADMAGTGSWALTDGTLAMDLNVIGKGRVSGQESDLEIKYKCELKAKQQ